MSELTLTQAQQMDPLMNIAAGGNAFGQLEHTDRSFGAMGKLGARLLIATASILGVAESTDLFTGAEVAHADYRCSRFDPGAYRVDGLDENGVATTYYMCPDNPTPTPTPTTTGGGNGGGGNNGGGNGGSGNTTQPTSPPKPSFEDILAFVGCSDGAGIPTLATELDALKGADGSGRLVTVIDDCPLDFYEETGILADYGRPSTNWEAVISNPDTNVTPNYAQAQAVNIYLKAEWDRLNAPATTVAPETTTTIAEVETADTTLEVTDTTLSTVTTIETTVVEDTETTDPEEATTPIDSDDGSGGSSVGNKIAKAGAAVLGVVGLGGLILVVRRRSRRGDESQTPPQAFGGSPVAGN